jgi:hypothetical protein
MKNLKQFLIESFDTRPANWDRGFWYVTERSAKTTYEFEVENLEYFVEITGIDGQYMVEFDMESYLPNNLSRKAYALTNTGNQYKVLITVIDCIRDFLDSDEFQEAKFDRMMFTAASKDRSRAKVYKRLLDKFLPKNKYKVSVVSSSFTTTFSIEPKE